MLVIKVWCLPVLSQDALQNLFKEIVAAVIATVPTPGVKNENDMLVLFPADLMAYGLGKEILVEIDDSAVVSNGYYPTGSLQLARNVRRAVAQHCPSANIIVRDVDSSDVTRDL